MLLFLSYSYAHCQRIRIETDKLPFDIGNSCLQASPWIKGAERIAVIPGSWCLLFRLSFPFEDHNTVDHDCLQ